MSSRQQTPGMPAIRLLQITDTHCYSSDDSKLSWADRPVYPNRSLRALLSHLKTDSGKYDAMIWTGDLVQEETAQAYLRLSELAEDFPLTAYAIPGNHDVSNLMNASLRAPIRKEKAAVFGDWHVILVDTHREGHDEGHISDGEYAELESSLRTVPQDRHAVVFMHHHPIDIGSEWMDKMALQNRERFWELLEKYPQVKAVFHGHTHQEFSGEFIFPGERKVPVYGTPATCIQVKPRTKMAEFDHVLPGWREISLSPGGAVDTRVRYLSEL